MRFAECSITANYNFNKRICENFLYAIRNIQSNIYFITLDRSVSAQSIIGLLSLSIKKGDIIRINAINSNNEQAEIDLEFVKSVILGEM